MLSCFSFFFYTPTPLLSSPSPSINSQPVISPTGLQSTMHLNILFFASLASAAVIPQHEPRLNLRQLFPACTTGSPQCCNSVQSSNSPAVSALAGLLGVVFQSLTTQVGVTCKWERAPTSISPYTWSPSISVNAHLTDGIAF